VESGKRGDEINRPTKRIFQGQTEPREIEERSARRQIYKQIEVALWVMLAAHNRPK
jgi:hypothetical protein